MIATVIITALFIIFIILFFALRLPALKIPTHATSSEKLAHLDSWFQILYKKEKFNGSVLLSQKGKVVFSKSYGYAGVENLQKLDEHSSFNLASVSKQFTAMAIVLLHEQSKLGYDDRLSKFVPEMAQYEDVTIKDLLHHTSGLPEYLYVVAKYLGTKELVTAEEILVLYKKHKPKRNFKAGEKFLYSNIGYVLLAKIVERVSGVSFDKFIQTHIFEALNMKDTQVFNLISSKEPASRVYGFKRKYWLLGGAKKLQDLNNFDGVAGDGAVYSSTHDLQLWHIALTKGTLVSKEKYEVAYRGATLNNGSQTNYGFGWFLNKDSSVDHAGGWQGFTSYIYRDLESEDLIVILDNSSNTLRVNAFGFRFNSIGLVLRDFIKGL